MEGMKKVRTLIKCKIYKDNQAAITKTQSPKGFHRMNHISTKMHHFKEYILAKTIPVLHILTNQQITDIFMKALPTTAFVSLCSKLIDW